MIAVYRAVSSVSPSSWCVSDFEEAEEDGYPFIVLDGYPFSAVGYQRMRATSWRTRAVLLPVSPVVSYAA
jgi:hypothetical protein